MPGPRSDSSPGRPTRDDWRVVVARFPEAAPGLVAGRSLTTRIDTKFLASPGSAFDLLRNLPPRYAVLPFPQGFGVYHTLYFDTPQLDLFHAHRRGGRIRHKVRVRHYLDREVSVLEVKTRINEMRTVKFTRARPFGDDRLSPDDRHFIARHLGPGPAVVPQVWTRYRRLTLFGLDTDERATLDLELQVDMDGRECRFDGTALLEVKQPHFQRTTPIMAALRRLGIRSGWSSKYCLGIATVRPAVRLTGLSAAIRGFTRGAA